ncbi:hypothetical protein [Halosolutus gelatinilyticus]|uniref:hypothetical protein n=1 Tax=Halosolutus gelatinilyticus TaxID=2931975 RepID=UPI001FF18283|nr:hypothetical protein [Halosolutus gelatinilyticus]
MGDDRADGDIETGGDADTGSGSDTHGATESADRLECDLCGDRVPAAVYREHLLKECPGR